MNRQSINFRQKAQRHSDTTSAATAQRRTELKLRQRTASKRNERARARVLWLHDQRSMREGFNEGLRSGRGTERGGGRGVDLRSARRGNYYKMIKTTKTKSNQCANWTWTWPDLVLRQAIASDWIGSRLDYNNYNRLRAIHQITTTTTATTTTL